MRAARVDAETAVGVRHCAVCVDVNEASVEKVLIVFGVVIRLGIMIYKIVSYECILLSSKAGEIEGSP